MRTYALLRPLRTIRNSLHIYRMSHSEGLTVLVTCILVFFSIFGFGKSFGTKL